MTPLLDLREAARLLGVSVWTIRRLIDRRALTPIRVGRRVLIEASTLEAFIAANRGGPHE